MELQIRSEASAWGKKCPNFLGIKEHGQRLDLDLKENLNGASRIIIYADGTIVSTKTKYNWSTEEHEEIVVEDLTNNKVVRNAIEDYLSHNFIEVGFYGSYRFSSIEEVSSFLKRL